MWLLAVLSSCDSGPPPELVPKIAIEGRFALASPATGAGTVIGTWLASGAETWLVGVQAPDGGRRVYRVSKERDAVELAAPDSLHKGAWFGISGATHGPWAVIGAVGDPEGDDPGTVEVYGIGTKGWAWERQLTFDGASPALGLTVAATEGRVVIADREAQVVHVVKTDTWETEQTLSLSVPGVESLAIEGTTLLAGVPSSDAVLVFRHDGSTWSELEAISGPSGGQFGAAVAMRGGRAVVGAPQTDGGDGAVYIYAGSGGVFTESNHHGPQKTGVSAHLGTTVAIVDDVVLAGAPGVLGESGKEPGVVEAFGACDGKWGRGGRLAGVGAAGDGFGSALAVADDVMLAASPNARASGGRRGRVDGMRVRPARCVIPAGG